MSDSGIDTIMAALIIMYVSLSAMIVVVSFHIDRCERMLKTLLGREGIAQVKQRQTEGRG